MITADWVVLFSLLLNGLVTASMLFIVSAGLSIIFGVTQIVNFAHGSFYMLGAFVAYSVSRALGATGFGFLSSLIGASAAVTAVSCAIELVILRRLYKAPELLQLLATYGCVLVIQDATKWIWGYEDLLGPKVPGLEGAVNIFGVNFAVYNLFIIAVGPALLTLLWLVFYRTRWGTMVRAATEDREMLGALGVNQKWLFTIVFSLGGGLAGLAGAIRLPRDAANLGMDFNMLTEAFVVVVIGGLGSLSGAFFAALLIGVLESFGTLLLPDFTPVLIFLIMAVVLVVRPRGLGRVVQMQPRVVAGGLSSETDWAGMPNKALMVGILFAFTLIPWVSGDYVLSVVTEIMILILFTVSIHFLVGQSGILTFGHAAFFGIGAYCVTLMVKHLGTPMLGNLAIAPLAAGFGAAIFGWFCIRLGGIYRAMLTLAFAQIVWSVLLQWIEVTGGDNGILRVWPASWARSREVYYWLTFVVCGVGVITMWRIGVSPFGYMLRAARDSALRAEAIGIYIKRVQWAAFVLAGMVAGLAGGVYAYGKGSVFPNTASIETSVDGLAMLLLGGVEATIGPVVGATIYHWVQSDIMRVTDYWRAVFGVLIILLVVVFPDGIAGTTGRCFSRLRWQRVVGALVQRPSR